MQRLSETAPGIHQAFLQGQFVVKRTPGMFKAVTADQSLEPTNELVTEEYWWYHW